MRLDIFVKFEHDELKNLVQQLTREIQKMATNLDALTAQVQKNSDAVDSAIVLIQGLRQQIIDAGTDPAKLLELTNSLKQDEQQLADAVVVNTPAA